MKLPGNLILSVILLLLTTPDFAQPKSPAFIGPEKGALLIVGGGHLGPDIWARFVELAGGRNARIVIIPTANEDSAINTGKSFEKELLQSLGVQNVVVLHTRDPKIANTDSFVAPIKKATGIWFGGGRQWRLADAYLNTLAHKEFNALLNRGGVIGGSSAGATIQGSFLFRGDTKGNTVLAGDHTQGLDFIHNVAIDQHVLRRNRQFDLAGFVKTHPELLGIGIDENTAVVVQKNTFEVIGNSYVAVYDAAVSDSTKPFIFLGKGQQYNLKERKLLPVPGNPATAN
ncbi:cyanophycinase [Niastella koreensis]|uniref:Cyanophycinase n=2 Tax=Niastella koreensis TaxID=354356 RepID=G8TD80_NIAKG|nr:cyanophycinase [Niastella koreensis]AEV98312.1 cyanophycinase [Niastella koreensis GR20-10]OQP53233.1 cyanophycinase [Niastella koreensis]